MPDSYNYPYSPPEFLEGYSADEIHSRMLDALPDGIDKSEGKDRKSTRLNSSH